MHKIPQPNSSWVCALCLDRLCAKSFHSKPPSSGCGAWRPPSSPLCCFHIDYKQLFTLQTGHIPDKSLHEQLFPGRGLTFFFFFFFLASPFFSLPFSFLSDRIRRTAVVTCDSVGQPSASCACFVSSVVVWRSCRAEQKQQSKFSKMESGSYKLVMNHLSFS